MTAPLRFLPGGVQARARMATEGKSRTGGLWVPALDGVRGYLSISIALAHVMLATGWTP